jgi:epoxyqueuosine reductase
MYGGGMALTLTEKVKEHALELGYSRVGITSADEFTQYAEILKERGDSYDWWTHGARKPLEAAQPTLAFPDAKSIIVMIYDYAQRRFPPELCALMGRVYQARCYFAPPDNINGTRITLMQDYLESLGIKSVNDFWLPQRWAAARAGVATFGRNACAYADGIGSFILITTLVVDASLDCDAPTLESKCPKDCRRCIDACPTGALSEPFTIDPRKCIPFNNWMTVSGRSFGITETVPRELRASFGQRIHGCDACQEACPRNRKKLKDNEGSPPDAFLQQVAGDLKLERILHLTDDYYETRLKPLMYNYIRDTRIFQRNAAIALGNTRDPAYVPDLAQDLSNDYPPIRAHVAWALGQIAGEKAVAALQDRLPREKDTSVREEILAALAEASR